MRIGIATVAIATALLAAARADAHVTLNPRTVPAGGESIQLDVRVPDESSTASTIKVAMKLPDGFPEVLYEPVPGWKVTVTRSRAVKPLETEEGQVDQQVSVITWTGHGTHGRIPPGQFRNFPITVGIPDTPGRSLVFKSVQTYSDGKVTRWIGPPGSDNEAAVVEIGPGNSPAVPRPSSPGGASKGLAVTALVIGALGLLAGGVALVAGRRRSGPPQ